jgi:hypothetical protein
MAEVTPDLVAPVAARPPPLWPEALLTFAILVAVARVIQFFFVWHYLPQPFVYDSNGTFMDWINPAYWAHHPGAFDVWHAVYPPLSFVFLKIFSIGSCYQNDDNIAAWTCDWWARTAILGFYALNAVITFKCYRKSDRRTAVLRTVALMLGLPMLYALERGNLILPCFTFFALGYGRVFRFAWLRWLSVAMTINFKPYLLFAALPLAARKRWRWLEGCGLAAVLVYLVTYAVIGSGSPMELLDNQKLWLYSTGFDYWWNIYYTTSYAPFLTAIQSEYPVLSFVGSRLLEGVLWWVPLLIKIGQIGVVASMVAAWFRPAAAPMYRMAALGLSLVLTASNPSGYTEVFIVFLVFFEPWRGAARVTALVAAYLISIPFDHIIFGVIGFMEPSLLGNRLVSTDFGLSVGQLVRPGLLLVIQYALVAATLIDAARAPRPTAALDRPAHDGAVETALA